MKKSLLNRIFRPSFLAIPASALMLGASQAQTTVAINFVAQYGSNTNYAAVGTGYAGYQMTGFPVTTNAFGVAAANWVNPAPMYGFFNYATGPYTNIITAGPITINTVCHNLWSSDIGDLDPYPFYSGGASQPNTYWSTPGSVNPGNDQVTWAIEDTGGWTNTLSGLATVFPHGYVLQLISASGNTGTKLTPQSRAIITDGAIFTNSLAFNIYTAGNTNAPGTVGLAASPTLTNDVITMTMDISNKCSLAGFIITDQPVISQPSIITTNFYGSTFVFNANAAGVSPLSYQWYYNGVAIPGATVGSFTNSSLTFTNAGNYSVKVTNPYGSASNLIASLTIAPLIVQLVPGNIIQDTKPIGIPHPGYNFKTTWLSASTDSNSTTRTGVEQFVNTNKSQITIAATPDFNTTNGTICFWMNYNIAADGFALSGPGNEAAMLFDRRATNNGNVGTVIALNSSGGIQFQATGGARFVGNNTTLPNGNWHHVAVTYGQTTKDAVSIYVDGVLDLAVTNPGAWSWSTGLNIDLGCSRDSYWKIYNGQLDDFRIYNRILTASEIAMISTPSNSDQLVDQTALMVRYNFDADSTFLGKSLVWPHGLLQSSSTINAGSTWTTWTNAISPQPFSIDPSVSAQFYRLLATP